MKRVKPRRRTGRNELCPCGSMTKFKYCHGGDPTSSHVITRRQYVDQGETPVRWIISNETGSAFFSDIQNRILVFADRTIAVAVIRLDLFSDAAPFDINLAGVGPTKWQQLQESLPFIEVESFEHARALLIERITGKKAELAATQEVLIHGESQEAADQEFDNEIGRAHV